MENNLYYVGPLPEENCHMTVRTTEDGKIVTYVGDADNLEGLVMGNIPVDEIPTPKVQPKKHKYTLPKLVMPKKYHIDDYVSQQVDITQTILKNVFPDAEVFHCCFYNPPTRILSGDNSVPPPSMSCFAENKDGLVSVHFEYFMQRKLFDATALATVLTGVGVASVGMILATHLASDISPSLEWLYTATLHSLPVSAPIGAATSLLFSWLGGTYLNSDPKHRQNAFEKGLHDRYTVPSITFWKDTPLEKRTELVAQFREKLYGTK